MNGVSVSDPEATEYVIGTHFAVTKHASLPTLVGKKRAGSFAGAAGFRWENH